MNYEIFLETVKELLQAQLGPDHHLEIHEVPKNNGVMLDGISDHHPASPLAPTVYLNSYYSQYDQGEMTIEEICDDILQIFLDHPTPDGICAEDFSDIQKMRPLIMMKLIHSESNQSLLKDTPHIPYLDLSIVFYISLERSEQGQLTILIRQDYLRQWNMDQYDLLRLAMENTPLAYPAEIHSMSQVLMGVAKDHLGADYDEGSLQDLLAEDEAASSLYVLTNSSGIYGAACMLYRKILKNFADLLNRDLIIIPSSVHEVLLAPLELDVDLNELNHIISVINQSEVSQEDRLSNHVYQYNRLSDDISIPVF